LVTISLIKIKEEPQRAQRKERDAVTRSKIKTKAATAPLFLCASPQQGGSVVVRQDNLHNALDRVSDALPRQPILFTKKPFF
jgi:hypothetical protein